MDEMFCSILFSFRAEEGVKQVNWAPVAFTHDPGPLQNTSII